MQTVSMDGQSFKNFLQMRLNGKNNSEFNENL